MRPVEAIRAAARQGAVLAVLACGATAVLAQGGFASPWPDDTTPVRLRVPSDYAQLQGWSAAGGSATMNLHYPSMRPWGVVAGCREWCEGKLLLVVRTGERSELNREVWSLRRAIAREAAAASPTTAYTARPPPAGYTEAWEERRLTPQAMPLLPEQRMLYLRIGPDGAPQEYAQCAAAAGGAARCDTMTVLEGAPAVQLKYSFAAPHWAERDAIRAAIMRLVRGWL